MSALSLAGDSRPGLTERDETTDRTIEMLGIMPKIRAKASLDHIVIETMK